MTEIIFTEFKKWGFDELNCFWNNHFIMVKSVFKISLIAKFGNMYQKNTYVHSSQSLQWELSLAGGLVSVYDTVSRGPGHDGPDCSDVS